MFEKSVKLCKVQFLNHLILTQHLELEIQLKHHCMVKAVDTYGNTFIMRWVTFIRTPLFIRGFVSACCRAQC